MKIYLLCSDSNEQILLLSSIIDFSTYSEYVLYYANHNFLRPERRMQSHLRHEQTSTGEL